MTNTELIQEAKNRVSEIAKASKNCPCGKYTAIYESDNGVTVSHIQKNWDTRTTMLSFGNRPMTKKQVLQYIEAHN